MINQLWTLAWFACLSIPDTTPLGQHRTPSHHDERRPDTANARHMATLVVASSLVLMLVVHRKGFRVLVLAPLEATEGRPPFFWKRPKAVPQSRHFIGMDSQFFQPE